MVLHIEIRPLSTLQTLPPTPSVQLSNFQNDLKAAQTLQSVTQPVNTLSIEANHPIIDYNVGIDLVKHTGGVRAGKWGFSPNLISTTNLEYGEVPYRMAAILNQKEQREWEAQRQYEEDAKHANLLEKQFRENVDSYVKDSEFDIFFAGVGYQGDGKSIDDILKNTNYNENDYLVSVPTSSSFGRGKTITQARVPQVDPEAKNKAFEKLIPQREINRKKVQEYIDKKISEKLQKEIELKKLAAQMRKAEEPAFLKFAQEYFPKKTFQIEKLAIDLKNAKTQSEQQAKLKALIQTMNELPEEFSKDFVKENLQALTIDTIIGMIGHALSKSPHIVFSTAGKLIEAAAIIDGALKIGQTEIGLAQTAEIIKEIRYDFCQEALFLKAGTPLLAEVDCNEYFQ